MCVTKIQGTGTERREKTRHRGGSLSEGPAGYGKPRYLRTTSWGTGRSREKKTTRRKKKKLGSKEAVVLGKELSGAVKGTKRSYFASIKKSLYQGREGKRLIVSSP